MTRVLAFQTVALYAQLAFGIVALRVSRAIPPARRDRRASAWALTGYAFTILGVLSVVHATAAVWAVAEGPGSAVYRTYLEWMPGGNYARAMLALVFGALLFRLLLLRGGLREETRFVRRSVWPLTVVPLAVAVVGRLEGWTSAHRYLSIVSVIVALTVVTMGAALLVALNTDDMDQLLWLALSVYVLKEGLSVSIYSVAAWLEFTRSPPPVLLYTIAIVATGVMTALAARRLVMARQGRPVPSLFERLSVHRPRASGWSGTSGFDA